MKKTDQVQGADQVQGTDHEQEADEDNQPTCKKSYQKILSYSRYFNNIEEQKFDLSSDDSDLEAVYESDSEDYTK